MTNEEMSVTSLNVSLTACHNQLVTYWWEYQGNNLGVVAETLVIRGLQPIYQTYQCKMQTIQDGMLVVNAGVWVTPDTVPLLFLYLFIENRLVGLVEWLQATPHKGLSILPLYSLHQQMGQQVQQVLLFFIPPAYSVSTRTALFRFVTQFLHDYLNLGFMCRSPSSNVNLQT